MLLIILVVFFFTVPLTHAQIIGIDNYELDTRITEKYDEITNEPLGKYENITEIIPVEILTDDILSLRTYNSKTFRKGDHYQTIFYPGLQFYNDNGVWLQVEYSQKPYFDKISLFNYFIQTVYADTFAVGSGDCAITVSAGNCAAAYTASQGTVSAGDATRNVYIDDGFNLRRLYFPFDTSSLPDSGITIGTSSLFLDDNGHVNNDLDMFLLEGVGTSTTHCNTTDFEPADYDEISDRINTADVTGAYNEFVLNNAGTSSIDTTGITSFLLTYENSDCNDGTLYTTFNMQEQTGTANDPYLVVNWASSTEEEETGTTTEATPGSIDPLNDIAIIQGYAEEYTSSTSTPSKVIYYTFHIPFFVWLFMWLTLSFIFGRIIIELLIILRK